MVNLKRVGRVARYDQPRVEAKLGEREDQDNCVPRTSPSPVAEAAEGLMPLGVMMAAAFWRSQQRNRLFMLAVALSVVVAATAYLQIRLNAWNQPFYNALTNKDQAGFFTQLKVFAVLASLLLTLNVAQTWLNQTSKLVLRRGLVEDLFAVWLAPQRAFRLVSSHTMGANPDQRLQADAQHLADLTTDLSIGLLQSTLLLASFIGVLWVLSDGMSITLAGVRFAPPGYMVWCALFYAATASFLSWRVGRPLIRLDAEHYAREAELRFGLVLVNENIESITLYGGEANEMGRLRAVFCGVLAITRRIIGAATRLTWITAGYGWFTIVAPIVVAAPEYFAGKMTFGELMMVVGAFNQVQQSLRWFVDNFSAIADWQATLLRVAGFRRAVLTMDKLGLNEQRITRDASDGDVVALEGLRVAAPSGCIRLSETHLVLAPGERVLISGAQNAGKTLLFRALAGLWPWGAGRIALPAGQVMFLPSRGYVPPGVLRASVTYPAAPDAYAPEAVAQALGDVGLDRLVPLLETSDRWDRQLSEDEKHRVALVRVILQRPKWVVIDDVLDLIDPVSRRRIEGIFMGDLAEIGIVNIGQGEGQSGFFTRKLRLEVDAAGPMFRPQSGARPARTVDIS
jgi:vitamin B12/bleomycin/antimicrobial peptide transport system ATP-binding/permease protein